MQEPAKKKKKKKDKEKSAGGQGGADENHSQLVDRGNDEGKSADEVIEVGEEQKGTKKEKKQKQNKS